MLQAHEDLVCHLCMLLYQFTDEWWGYFRFQIVGRVYDCVACADVASQYYETIYALLDNISPQYQRSFGDALMSKLSQLEQSQEDSSPSDVREGAKSWQQVT